MIQEYLSVAILSDPAHIVEEEVLEKINENDAFQNCYQQTEAISKHCMHRPIYPHIK